jgi:hypothetical protein
LQEFNTVFHDICKNNYPTKLLFENCCEEFESYIQHVVGFSSDCEDERDILVEEMGGLVMKSMKIYFKITMLLTICKNI